ncbi:MAG: AAA family ATPase [Planctomycetaceae bacterium]|nr:AAA family ATPase [Planctomycetaceae bacterium]
MKDAIRVVLVDPRGETCEALQRLLSGIGSVWLAEVCPSYAGAAGRIAKICPHLAIITIDSHPEQAIQLIQTIVQQSPGVVVLPAGLTRDSSIILQVIRAGAREFLLLPTESAELIEAIRRLDLSRSDERSVAPRGPQIIAVTAAAGGVGCTSLAVNLATTLARSSKHGSVLVDFDLLFGSTDACLDLVPDHSILEVVQNIERLDLTLLKRTLTRHDSGLYLLPRPTAMNDAVKLDPELLRRGIVMLQAAFASVVIDTSKGFQSTDFVAFEMADVILMVVELNLTCLRNTARLLQLFQEFDGMAERVKLIANRAGAFESEISIRKAEETLKLPITWRVPNDTKVFRLARSKGVPIDVIAAGSKIHQSLLAIARALQPFPAAETAKARKGLFSAFF